MRDRQNAEQVALTAPDYMGFIFYEKSPRFVGESFRAQSVLPSGVTGVAVFVNESVPKMLSTLAQNGLNWVQLHGYEKPEVVRALKEVGITVIKVFSIDDNFDFAATKKYHEADYFLFDTKGRLYGGNAERWNWSKLIEYDQKKPFFLSGGIDLDNISNVANLLDMNIHCIDVNSGVEIEPGLKDPARVRIVKQKLNEVSGS